MSGSAAASGGVGGRAHILGFGRGWHLPLPDRGLWIAVCDRGAFADGSGICRPFATDGVTDVAGSGVLARARGRLVLVACSSFVSVIRATVTRGARFGRGCGFRLLVQAYGGIRARAR